MVIGIKLEGDVLNLFQVILLLMTPRHCFQSHCIKPDQLRLLALLHVRASLLCSFPLYLPLFHQDYTPPTTPNFQSAAGRKKQISAECFSLTN